MNPVVNLQPATPTERVPLVALLQSLQLPTEDLPLALDHFIVAQDAGSVVGSVGLEIYGNQALFRSLAVTSPQQGRGLGKALYQAALALALTKGVKELYLITTSAAPFFEKQGFRAVERSVVPAAIQQTDQFGSVCPASATVMRLAIP